MWYQKSKCLIRFINIGYVGTGLTRDKLAAHKIDYASAWYPLTS